jgi:hypothetical protein
MQLDHFVHSPLMFALRASEVRVDCGVVDAAADRKTGLWWPVGQPPENLKAFGATFGALATPWFGHTRLSFQQVGLRYQRGLTFLPDRKGELSTRACSWLAKSVSNLPVQA